LPKVRRKILSPPKPRPQSMMKSEDFAPKITHEKFQSMVVKFAQLNGWRCQYWWRSMFSPKGFPDLFMARELNDGSGFYEVVVAELKTDKDKPSPEQTEWLNILGKVKSVRAFCWYYRDWSEIEKVLGR
jgi:hypothetical protein